MNAHRALLPVAMIAGAFAAAVLSAIMMFARMMGMPMRLELLIGSLVTGSVSPAAWFVGYVIHIAAGAVIALVYVLILGRLANVAAGAALGAIHALVSGTLLALVPAFHPLVPEVIDAPGPFMAALGPAGIAVFVGVHVLYGMIIGGACGVAVPQVTIHSPR